MSNPTRIQKITGSIPTTQGIKNWPAIRRSIEDTCSYLSDYSANVVVQKACIGQKFYLTLNGKKVGEIELCEIERGKGKPSNQVIGKIISEIKKQGEGQDIKDLILNLGENELATRLKCKLTFYEKAFGDKPYDIELLKLYTPKDEDDVTEHDTKLEGDGKNEPEPKEEKNITSCTLSSNNNLLPRHIEYLKQIFNSSQVSDELNVTLVPNSGIDQARKKHLLTSCHHLSDLSFSETAKLLKPGETLTLYIAGKEKKEAYELGIFTVQNIYRGKNTPSNETLEDMLERPKCKGVDPLISAHAEHEVGTKIHGTLTFSNKTSFNGEAMDITLVKLLDNAESIRAINAANNLSKEQDLKYAFVILDCKVHTVEPGSKKYIDYMKETNADVRLHLIPEPKPTIQGFVASVLSDLQKESGKAFDVLLPNDIELNLISQKDNSIIGRVKIKDLTTNDSQLADEEKNEIATLIEKSKIDSRDDIGKIICTMAAHKIATRLTCEIKFNENAPGSCRDKTVRAEIRTLELKSLGISGISEDKKTINNCKLSTRRTTLTTDNITALQELGDKLYFRLRIVS